jgi:hypothetical protein
MKTSNRGRFGLAMAAGILAATAIPAVAQVQLKSAEDEIKLFPPKPTKADNDPLLWNMFGMVFIIAAVVGANMIPAKRGHQD